MSTRNGFFRRLVPYLVVLLCLASLGFAAYLIYLDQVVRTRFEGARWALPAKVYARPLELYPGLPLDTSGLRQELERLGYRLVQQSDGPGTFRTAAQSLELTSREFMFWDGLQPSRRIQLSFANGVVETLKDSISGESLTLARLDPLLIGSIYPAQGQDRVLVRLEDVAPMLPEGLILIEDRRFYSHSGVDPRSIMRAFFANLIAGRVVQGGSTITQQLVKNFYLDNRQTLGRKIREALMALLVEAHYGKKEILETYLNEVYLGQDGNRAIHGFGLGSYFYFQKPPNELQPHEIALLVALVKGPSFYDPRRHPQRAKERRDLVLDAFVAEELITAEQATAAKARPLGVTKRGFGPTQYPAFVELVKRQLRGRYNEKDLTTEGLRIFTTLDPRVQTAAETHVSQGLAELEKARGLRPGTLQAAAVITTSDGGEVLGLVGGREPKFAGFNRALDARRQIGSLAKPVVYLTALARPQEFNLLTSVDDDEIEVELSSGKVWRPQNYDQDFHGDIDLHHALEKSYNVATVRVALQVGMPEVVDTFKRLGFRRDTLAVPSLALGAIDMTPLEVAQIYSTIASGGFYSPLLAIREVMTQDNRALGHYRLQIKQTFPEGPVYLLNWALERVMHAGTGTPAYNVLPPALRVAGKTGSTNDLRDSWFAGFSGNRVAVVWVGRDDNNPGRLSGAAGALPLWSRIMRDSGPLSFSPVTPEDVEFFPFDATDTDHDDEGCRNPVMVPFIRGSLPADFRPCEDSPDPDRMRGSDSRDGGSRDEPEPPRRKKRRDDGPLKWLRDLFR